MTDPWLDRCPEGHSSLRSRREGYCCQSCGVRYRGEPYDPRQTEFPVEGVRADA